MNRNGFTLVEMMIALALLSVVLFAASMLHSSASRLEKTVQDETKLRHELNYVLRDMERNLMAARDPIIDPTQIPGCATSCLDVKRDDDNGTVTVDYLYDATQKQISRRITDDTGAAQTDILATGTIVQMSGVPMFQISEGETNDRVQVNISAQNQTQTIQLPAITKSILLRGTKT